MNKQILNLSNQILDFVYLQAVDQALKYENKFQ